MRKTLPILLIGFFLTTNLFATRIQGTVTDDKGKPLAFASVLVKGTTKGTTASNDGKYFIDVDPGTYTISAQYVGYERVDKKVTVGTKNEQLDFQLSLLQLSLKEVVVRPGAEDPAYEIIRNAIKKRKGYENPLDSFTCEAYIKTLVRTRKLPKKVFGQKIEERDKKDMGVDSAGRGIIYLSESLTRIAYKKPNKIKLEVLSGRESGSSGFGFSFPTFINFYSNNVTVLGSQLNPRGFVSPIADGALNFYKYQYLGSFWEDGKEINQIKVTPRRKFEPLFSGTINITEGDWRIHSLDLALFKESQLQILDTIKIRQQHVPISREVWRTKDQVVYFTFNQFGIDAVGNFLNVYNKYEVAPSFARKFFNNVTIKYDTAVNKKTKAYWDSIRPIPLEPEEIRDYKTKDSLFQDRRDSAFSKSSIDSLRKRRGPIKFKQIVWTGFARTNYKPDPIIVRWEPVIRNLEYNTAEGLAINAGIGFDKRYPQKSKSLSVMTYYRYGLSNSHFNAWATINYSKRSFNWDENGGTVGRGSWTLSGGQRVVQFNRDNPISPLINSWYTLVYKQNYLKNYENRFVNLKYNHRFDAGLNATVGLSYEDRLPLENTTDFSVIEYKTRSFTPNYPFEQLTANFTRHQATLLQVDLSYRPGQKYIQFPRNKVPIGSKYPTLGFQYVKGISRVLGSNVNFDRWKFSVWDDVNLKLKGLLKYRFSIGGFLNSKAVFIQDYQHFNGNQLLFASQYTNSFQLAPYYANSTTASVYATAHLEHHFNGLLTNKIPGFRRLNWTLVGGANSFYVNKNNNYGELFVGVENIFKLFRIDFVSSYLNGSYNQTGIRLGLGGLIGGSVQVSR